MTKHWGQRPCKFCRAMVTNNALGRAAHRRGAKCIEREFRNQHPAFSYRMAQIAAFVVSTISREKPLVHQDEGRSTKA